MSALHEPFSWFSRAAEESGADHFASQAYDITRGITIILQLIHADAMDRDGGRDTSLSQQAIENLTLMAIASGKMLANEAELRIEACNHRAAKVAQ